jgi:hypothetical protein
MLPFETDIQAMTAPVRNMDKKKLDHQVFLGHFKPVYIGI